MLAPILLINESHPNSSSLVAGSNRVAIGVVCAAAIHVAQKVSRKKSYGTAVHVLVMREPGTSSSSNEGALVLHF